MIANPEDLVHGREGSGVVNPNTSDRAVQSYWKTEPTGKKGLLDVNTKKGN
jgi:pilus assembly protein CpaD